MARENDLDPEDDTKISGSSSLNVTYKSRIVIRDCENTGAVQAKKECAGGIVGSMDMGTVMNSRSRADLTGTEADYVAALRGAASLPYATAPPKAVWKAATMWAALRAAATP